MMNNYGKRLIAVILALAMSLSLLYGSAWAGEYRKDVASTQAETVAEVADDTNGAFTNQRQSFLMPSASGVNVPIEVTYHQSEARAMLAEVNEFRTSDTWYWNKDNTTKQSVSGLSALTYDYELEKVAMQRAAEIALYYSHTRPNGLTCFSAWGEHGYAYYGAGENIAAGYGGLKTHTEVFTAWREDDQLYARQGHRRNMLGSNFNRCAFACVSVGRNTYWVQLFSNTSQTTSQTTACDSLKTVTISASEENMTVTATPSVTSLTVEEGKSVLLPTVQTKVDFGSFGGALETKIEYQWSLSGSCATISGSTLSGVTAGTATLSTTVLGKTVTVPVTVTAIPTVKNLTDCTVALSTASYTYDGTEKKPVVTVKDGDKTLVEGTDYTLSYADNINAGTATVTVTGKGDYTGAVNKSFTIAKVMQAITVSSSVAVKVGETVALNASAKTALSYATSNSAIATVNASGVVTGVKAGTTTVTITATGNANYQGASKTVEIVVSELQPTVKDLGKTCTVTLSAIYFTYDGTEKKPVVTVKDGDKTLVEGTDYIVTYAFNIYAGQALLNVDGRGSYNGGVSKYFIINKAEQTIDAPSSVTFEVGAIDKIQAQGKTKLSYATSDSDVATVNENGVVYAKKAGTATITITAAESANVKSATKTVTVTVTEVKNEKKNLSGCAMTVLANPCVYDGTEKKPTVTIKDGTKTLVKGTDYTLSYQNNVNAGTATVIATGMKNYQGELKKTFSIEKRALKIEVVADATVKVGESTSLNASALTKLHYKSKNESVATVDENGVVTGVKEGHTYITVTADETENDRYGAVTVYIDVLSNEPQNIYVCSVKLNTTSYTYDGTEKKPTVTVKDGDKTLVEGTDYTISYADNIKGGTARVTITGKGAYKGERYLYFTIEKIKQTIDVPSSVTIKVGQALSLNASAKSSTLVYGTSNGEVATITQNGVVTGQKAGTATITITAFEDENYMEATKKVAVTVKETDSSTAQTPDNTDSTPDNSNPVTTEEKTKNVIHASNVTKTFSSKAQTFNLNCSNDGNLPMTYKASNGKVKVTSAGRVMIPANFVGTVTITVRTAETESYLSTAKVVTIKVNKANQPLTVSPTSKTYKVADVKKKAQSFTIKATKAQGKVTYKSSNSQNVTVTAKGKVTVKKGAKKGKYTITVTAAGNKNYKSGSKKVTVTVK